MKLPSSASEHRAHGTRTFREQETGKIKAEQETSLKQLSEATKISKVDTPSENIYKGKKKLERNPLKNTESHRGYEKTRTDLYLPRLAAPVLSWWWQAIHCIPLILAGDWYGTLGGSILNMVRGGMGWDMMGPGHGGTNGAWPHTLLLKWDHYGPLDSRTVPGFFGGHFNLPHLVLG